MLNYERVSFDLTMVCELQKMHWHCKTKLHSATCREKLKHNSSTTWAFSATLIEIRAWCGHCDIRATIHPSIRPSVHPSIPGFSLLRSSGFISLCVALPSTSYLSKSKSSSKFIIQVAAPQLQVQHLWLFGQKWINMRWNSSLICFIMVSHHFHYQTSLRLGNFMTPKISFPDVLNCSNGYFQINSMLSKHVVHEIKPYANISMKDEVCSALYNHKISKHPKPQDWRLRANYCNRTPAVPTSIKRAALGCGRCWRASHKSTSICATLCQRVIPSRIIESCLW